MFTITVVLILIAVLTADTFRSDFARDLACSVFFGESAEVESIRFSAIESIDLNVPYTDGVYEVRKSGYTEVVYLFASQVRNLIAYDVCVATLHVGRRTEICFAGR